MSLSEPQKAALIIAAAQITAQTVSKDDKKRLTSTEVVKLYIDRTSEVYQEFLKRQEEFS